MKILPYVIGEAGSCHEESLSRALQLIQVGHDAGCQAIKFQFWSSHERMCQRRNVGTSGAYLQGSVKKDWFTNLMHDCHTKGMEFLCSVYLPEDVAEVAQWVDGFKVSSFEARDRELTKAIQSVRGERPLYISTGMQNGHEQSHLPNTAIQLHCVSAYPCPPEEANLGAIEPHGGYSDHTRCVMTGAFAVSAGADFLEVHYRLDSTSQNCPDFPVSLSPLQLARYVSLARAAHAMRGSGRKEPQPSEEMNVCHRVTS